MGSEFAPRVTSVQGSQIQISDFTLLKVMTTNDVKGFYIVERKFLLNTLYVFFCFVYCRYLYTFDTIGVLEPDQTLEISFIFSYKYRVMALESSLSCFSLFIIGTEQRINNHLSTTCSKQIVLCQDILPLKYVGSPEKGRGFAFF